MINIKNQTDYYFLIFSSIILTVLLFFPASSDLSAFIHGGMILNNGGNLYVDFFDVKPPFVYYMFELLYSMFGKNVFLYRLFDFVYQLAFLYSSIYIFRKLKLSSQYIRVYVLIMPLSYVVANYSNVLQMESLLYLPLIWYFYFTARPNKNELLITVIKGVLLGLIINLKYTFGLIIVADWITNYSHYKTKFEILKLYSFQLLVASLVTLICFSPVVISGNFDNFLMFFNYTKLYSLYPEFSFSYLINMIKIITDYYVFTYSIFFLLSALITIFMVKGNEYIQIVIKNTSIFFIILLITVILERKLLIYHEIRVYPFLVLLSSIGIVHIFSQITKYKKHVIIISVVIFLLFSSIPRLVNLIGISINKLTDSEVEYLSQFHDGNENHNLGTTFELAKYLNNNYDTSKLLFINSGGNELIVYLDDEYNYSLPISAFYLNKKAPTQLINKVNGEISNCKYIVIQNNDPSVLMFFNKDNSYDAIKKKKILWNNIQTNFKVDTILFENYFIYKRNTN